MAWPPFWRRHPSLKQTKTPAPSAEHGRTHSSQFTQKIGTVLQLTCHCDGCFPTNWMVMWSWCIHISESSSNKQNRWNMWALPILPFPYFSLLQLRFLKKNTGYQAVCRPAARKSLQEDHPWPPWPKGHMGHASNSSCWQSMFKKPLHHGLLRELQKTLDGSSWSSTCLFWRCSSLQETKPLYTMLSMLNRGLT